ncbi:protein serine/threonine phosphatase 2C [Hortaea werneckii]|nr:protein serine/threonine phosphatase 2C [Hortaea werneckii]
MRRALVQNLRTFRRPSPRKALKQLRINGPTSTYNVSFHRSIVSRNPQPLRAQMQLGRRLSGPLLLGAFAGGVAYFYQQQTAATSPVDVHSPKVTGVAVGPSKAYSTATGATQSAVGSVDELPEAVRKALIVDKGQLYTAQIPADQPLTKETDYSGRKVLEMLTPEQAAAKLRTNEESYLVGRGEGVVRYDVVQIPSNDPIEDDHVEKIVEVPDTIAATENGKTRSDWMFWGVFDGHAGWTTSAKLRQTLVSYVARELNATYQSALQDPKLTFPSSDAVDAAIKKGFLKLDNEITHESVQKVLKAQSKVVAAEF